MKDTRMVSQDVQDKITDQVRKGQAAVNGAIKAWIAAIESIRPQLPELSQSLPAHLPGRDALIANAQELAGQLRVAQRRLADQLRQAATPLAEQVRHATAPWAEQIHQVRKAATGQWTEQVHQDRKAAAPLADQAHD